MENDKNVTILYSGDSEEHKQWVQSLANELESNQINVTYDQNSLEFGDDVNQFMEIAVDSASTILAICSKEYKKKLDNRDGGSGYEGRMIADKIKNKSARVIPVVRDGFKDVLPNMMVSLTGVDLSKGFEDKEFAKLLILIHGYKINPSKSVKDPKETIAKIMNISQENIEIDDEINFQNVFIEGIISEKVTSPKNDGTRGSALYNIPFQLNYSPEHRWSEYFLHYWKNPSRFTTMHRSNIASVSRDIIWLKGTTLEEVKKYHKDTLLLAISEANKSFRLELLKVKKEKQAEEQREKDFRESVAEAVDDIIF